ncbi:hypothetical protein LUZ63_007232 [Rhynchospora breviuscula]|uniref:RING-type domain-containing protein n=1 Tax=Rhynchospora breviuscula TaxID=2022672 RepID=A0A9Q0CRW2_9POAL|nr:hypothetical protein LUZ63_007232 [Rhynchospora breviuscula]
MGLSNHVAPSDGILILLVANTALSVSLLRDLILSFLCLFTSQQPDVIGASSDGEPSFRDRFFDRFEPVRFGSAKRCADCCVCLNRFEPESVVSWLNCGHLLHKRCLETWMEYRHATCPMCRAHLLPGEEN